ncbi:MAG: HD domain-containing protein [Bacilli bacterium]
MSKAENVVRYYVLCNKLKDVIRTGWKNWNVKRERLESVAEHIYGVQMLAIAIQSEYKYDVDIMKVVFMLAIHELEEIIIGDLTQFQIAKGDKVIIGHEAVNNILDGLLNKEQIMNLIVEFDERKTRDALFAHYCDKLECDIQSKLYDEEGCVDLNDQDGNETLNDPRVQALLKIGKSWSDMWLTFGQNVYNYDENFTEISNYVINNNISGLRKK